jgi:adenosylcobinamide kinase / adenosylcobinamide-phosphate guanylyltransferase
MHSLTISSASIPMSEKFNKQRVIPVLLVLSLTIVKLRFGNLPVEVNENSNLDKLLGIFRIMKTLFIGGIKSGKSRLAEAYILEQAKQKPYYLATTEFIDDEMRQRIAIHQLRREGCFITIEEPIQLLNILRDCPGPVLIECVSMWLNNMLYHKKTEDRILQELTDVMALSSDMVFVLNEVGLAVIADNPLARQYVDLSGKVGQLLGEQCDQVFFCCAGLSVRLKC